jgi:hypothetical protein
LQGKHDDVGLLLQGYDACVDWPACNIYRELMQANPEAKVLLNVREPEKWYQSVIDTIYIPYEVYQGTTLLICIELQHVCRCTVVLSRR